VDKKKYACLFGFCLSAEDQVGYLASRDGVLTVVQDPDDALKFAVARPRGAKGWAPPEKWVEFFKGEMPDWKFHSVTFLAG